MVADLVYVVLTLVFRPFGFPLSPWEFVYVNRVECPLLWFYYILSHPYFAILWAVFIAVAAVQFYRLREWARRVLELVTGFALLVIPMAFFGLVLLFRGADSTGVLVWLGAAFVAGLVLFILCIVIYSVLGSSKVRRAMIGRRLPR
jgi:hypothetical protein